MNKTRKSSSNSPVITFDHKRYYLLFFTSFSTRSIIAFFRAHDLPFSYFNFNRSNYQINRSYSIHCHLVWLFRLLTYLLITNESLLRTTQCWVSVFLLEIVVSSFFIHFNFFYFSPANLHKFNLFLISFWRQQGCLWIYCATSAPAKIPWIR